MTCIFILHSNLIPLLDAMYMCVLLCIYTSCSMHDGSAICVLIFFLNYLFALINHNSFFPHSSVVNSQNGVTPTKGK